MSETVIPEHFYPRPAKLQLPPCPSPPANDYLETYRPCIWPCFFHPSGKNTNRLIIILSRICMRKVVNTERRSRVSLPFSHLQAFITHVFRPSGCRREKERIPPTDPRATMMRTPSLLESRKKTRKRRKRKRNCTATTRTRRTPRIVERKR